MKRQDKEYESILVISVGMSLLYLWLDHQVLLYISVGVGVIGLASSRLRSLIVYGWNQLALGLGYVNSRILLIGVYYLFLTPIALLRRLLSSPKSKLDSEVTSSFRDRSHTYSAKDFENPW